ncbi:hypothetical protein HYPSUDRAFT_65013 [Hypholoma sublateritium FD-334 SS-4]|uniref:Uncharacterized protein n=1 Tax=Hypholoma sublateritium (strain FD-334 SS-4) TaxID=945553 RepID=A0A0D2MM81_HYPSF|nr:hypothetical protein HYPSUDRAFT_65013 [Hypholoma sublateritium FD-334 SS-4]
MTRTQKQRLKSHISSDWHTAAVRLAGGIFRDFQTRMAVLNNYPRWKRRAHNFR